MENLSTSDERCSVSLRSASSRSRESSERRHDVRGPQRTHDSLITYYLTSVLAGMGLGPEMSRILSGVNGTCYFLTRYVSVGPEKSEVATDGQHHRHFHHRAGRPSTAYAMDCSRHGSDYGGLSRPI